MSKPFNADAFLAQTVGGPVEKLPPPNVKVDLAHPLNKDQATAVDEMVEFLQVSDDAYFFLLEGPAGTGKTYCVKALINRIKGRLVFTAPTNKATKVLRESIQSPDYKPDCRTIYSLLGLKLETNGEIKELSVPEDPLDLSRFLAVVVDEASMVSKVLMKYIKEAALTQKVKFIFMGDRYQLPPVGEDLATCWDIPRKAVLSQVMRFDNQLLTLATEIRTRMGHIVPTIKLVSDNDGAEGVWSIPANDWEARIRAAAARGEFSEPNKAKAMAWRNATVNRLNTMIRDVIFDHTDQHWVVGDRIVMLAPANDFENEKIASTDDEGTVERVTTAYHPHYGQFKCYVIDVCFDDNERASIWLLHESAQLEFTKETERRAAEARANPRMWKNFWAFKDAFHTARHAYALTVHRAQGSTYETAYVDYRDILINRNRIEAFKCFYVAATRARKRLFLA